MAEREALRRRAISVNCLSSSSGSLIETTRIDDRVLPILDQRNTTRACRQMSTAFADRDCPNIERRAESSRGADQPAQSYRLSLQQHNCRFHLLVLEGWREVVQLFWPQPNLRAKRNLTPF